jgi:hypothetical protein
LYVFKISAVAIAAFHHDLIIRQAIMFWLMAKVHTAKMIVGSCTPVLIHHHMVAF